MKACDVSLYLPIATHLHFTIIEILRSQQLVYCINLTITLIIAIATKYMQFMTILLAKHCKIYKC